MALKTDTPIVTERINLWTVRALELILPESPDPLRMVVTLATGYDDGETTTWLREQYIEIPPADVLASWAVPIASTSIYDAVKASLYGYLIATSYIPADATER
jgi:hypothetical protein